MKLSDIKIGDTYIAENFGKCECEVVIITPSDNPSIGLVDTNGGTYSVKLDKFNNTFTKKLD